MAIAGKNKEDHLDDYLDGTLAYYEDPFVKTPQQPKIPDGKMECSIGFQNLSVKEFSHEALNSADSLNLTYIIMSPSIDAPIKIVRPVKTDTVTELTDYDFNAGIDHMIDSSNWKLSLDTTNATRYAGDKFNPIYWRQVSQAINICPFNSSVTQNGYFECFSLPLPQLLRSHRYATSSTNNTFCVLDNEYVQSMEQNLNSLRDSKSYVSGSLNDLKNFSFRQLVNDTDHSPIGLPDTYKIDNPAGAAQYLMDLQFQIKVIRIRAVQETRFLLKHVQNLEFQFPFHSAIRAFQTINESAVDMENQNRLILEGEMNNGSRAIVSPDASHRKRSTNLNDSSRRRNIRRI